MELKVITPEFRVSFPHLFETHAFSDKSEPKYSVVMLFDKKTNLASLKKAAEAAGIKKWGEDRKKWPKGLRTPFRDGDEKMELDGYQGTVFVTASSKERPGVVDQKVRPIVKEDNALYAGCYARAEVVAYAYDAAGNRGIAFGLNNIQKLRDGDSFSGRRPAAQVFEAVDDGSEDESSYAGNSGADNAVAHDDGFGF